MNPKMKGLSERSVRMDNIELDGVVGAAVGEVCEH